VSRHVLIALAASLVAGSVSAAPNALKLGAAVPLSGPEANSGARVRDGYQLAVEIENEDGGLDIGAGRVQVTLQVLDDRSEPAADASAVEQLVSGGAAAILGSFGTPLVEAGSAAAEKLKVPYVAPTGSSRSLYERGFKYLFGLSAPIDQLANALMRWIEWEQQQGKLPTPVRIALVAEKTAHGKEYAAGVRDFVNKTARRRTENVIVLDETFELNQKQFKPLLTRIRDARADVLLVDAHVPDYVAMHAEYAKMGLCHKVISYGARGPERQAREQLGAKADYILSAVWWSAQMTQTNAVTKFVARFKARYGRMPDWYEALGYEAARALFEAVRRAGTTEREAVRAALEKLRMESILPGGFLAFPEQYGRQAQYLFLVQQNMPDGSAPVIYPHVAAVKDGVAPNPLCATDQHAAK
jgi:branched-chain amino acid transport system substrate-binding protein